MILDKDKEGFSECPGTPGTALEGYKQLTRSSNLKRLPPPRVSMAGNVLLTKIMKLSVFISQKKVFFVK